MRKRLIATVFGTLYYVGALRLTPDAMRVGISAYGSDAWIKILGDIALDLGPKKLSREVVHTIGRPIEKVYGCHGVALDGHPFGFEVFHAGEFRNVTMVEANHSLLHPAEFMRKFDKKDVLGVFWATMEGGMQFRWDHVETLRQEDVTLVYDNYTPLLTMKKDFNLVREVTWNGKTGKRKEVDFGTGLHAGMHVFHKGK